MLFRTEYVRMPVREPFAPSVRKTADSGLGLSLIFGACLGIQISVC
jgi:hypothetical protein